ncbi:hypothetical protein [Sphingopyxis sp.]|uniref:hypothetical protein n=1 Tax=Sphingopyxis sp. TaxID=1908224 RepID=UPI0035B33655
MADVGMIKTIDELYMFTKVGMIAGSQNWSETSISTTTTTSGGGGYMHQGSGFISPASTSTTTSSSTTEQLRLFVREDDGDEFEAKFSEPGFGVREGHRVLIVYAGDQASRRGYPMALANLSTNQSKVFTQRAGWIIKQIGQAMGCAAVGAFLVLAVVLGMVAGFVGVIIAAAPLGFLLHKHRQNVALAKGIVDAVSAEMRKAVEVERGRAAA